MNSKIKFKVTEYSLKKQVIKWCLLGVSVCVLMFASYWAGKRAIGFDTSDINLMQERVLKVNDKKRHLENENRRLLNQMTHYKRKAEFNRVSEQEANKVLAESQKKLSKINKELFFYKNLLNPDSPNHQLNIHSLVLVAPEQDVTSEVKAEIKEHGYLLTLTEFKRGDTFKTGKITITFEYADKKIKKETRKYKFKFFQRVQGVVPLRKNKPPQKIVLKLLNSKGGVILKKTYLWSKLQSGET